MTLGCWRLENRGGAGAGLLDLPALGSFALREDGHTAEERVVVEGVLW